MAGCGSTTVEEEPVPPPETEAPVPETPTPEAPEEEPPPPEEVEVEPIEPQPVPEQPRPPPPMFQPGFHQALRWSYSTGGVTFRLRVPVGRAGDRVRLAFRSGDGNLVLRKATIALAGPEGSLASAPVTVTFSGTPGFSVTARTRVVSDPVALPVGFRDELAVSFEVQGALAVSAIHALPGSFVRSGSHTGVTGPLGGTPWDRAVGLATVEVEGPPARAFVALGDSITEGYIDELDDTRLAWPSVAETKLGVPIVNAGVSGQGFYDALLNLDAEVLVLEGITDCVVLLGTNDLAGLTVDKLQARMSSLTERLRPFCRVWVGTLLPKEKSNHGAYETVKTQRLEMNAWIRDTFPDVIDFESVTRRPDNVHLFLDGLVVDGIHPSAEGHRVMATEAARVLREAGVQPEPGVVLPAEGEP
ncbi:SGNH/GDSL hydrolase family protein [Archangium lansingense]|uniref:SGNH/GDSL hydrolase family protein n=1 Tax=Archangium lansingense TaxID=2995310 RepID=UPI003B7C8089